MDEKQFKEAGKQLVTLDVTELAQEFGAAMMSEGTSKEEAQRLIQIAANIYMELSPILFEKVKHLDFYDRTQVGYVAASLLAREIKSSGLVSLESVG